MTSVDTWRHVATVLRLSASPPPRLPNASSWQVMTSNGVQGRGRAERALRAMQTAPGRHGVRSRGPGGVGARLPDAPKTMRVQYRIGWRGWRSEWICFEQGGWPRLKAESWWRQGPVPQDRPGSVRGDRPRPPVVSAYLRTTPGRGSLGRLFGLAHPARIRATKRTEVTVQAARAGPRRRHRARGRRRGSARPPPQCSTQEAYLLP